MKESKMKLLVQINKKIESELAKNEQCDYELIVKLNTFYENGKK